MRFATRPSTRSLLGPPPEAYKSFVWGALYDRLMVKRIEETERMQGSLHIPDSAKEKPQEGEVLAVVKGKRLEDGKLGSLDVEGGDRILFGKYSGSEIKLDGQEYLIMREDDVLGILAGRAEPAENALKRTSLEK